MSEDDPRDPPTEKGGYLATFSPQTPVAGADPGVVAWTLLKPRAKRKPAKPENAEDAA